jgi:hypothetical protein
MSDSSFRTCFKFLMATLPGIPFITPAALLSAAVCVYLAAPAPCAAQTPLYPPSRTTVAILPVVNESDSKSPEMRARQSDKAQQELTAQFAAHGFLLVPDSAVKQAISDAKIDLTDEDQQKRDTFYKIGTATHADLVAFLVITDTSQGWKQGFIPKREGKAKLKMWLVDADKQPILSAAVKEAKASANDFMTYAVGSSFGGSEYTIRAIGNGIKDELKDFFKPYPELKSGSKSTALSVAPPPLPAPVIPNAVAPLPSPVPTSLPVAAPTTQSVFTFMDGSQAIGTLLSFDGSVYTVNTTKGMRQFKIAAIKSIHALAPVTVTAAK